MLSNAKSSFKYSISKGGLSLLMEFQDGPCPPRPTLSYGSVMRIMTMVILYSAQRCSVLLDSVWSHFYQGSASVLFPSVLLGSVLLRST